MTASKKRLLLFRMALVGTTFFTLSTAEYVNDAGAYYNRGVAHAK